MALIHLPLGKTDGALGAPGSVVRPGISFGKLTMPFPIRLYSMGGIGFQFTGGIIVVTANPTGVNVSFDRPMLYNGAVTHNPPTAPFDVGTPALTGDSRSINLPINVMLLAAPTVSAVPLKVKVVFGAQVTLTVSGNVPANWTFTASGGATPIVTTNVSLDPNGTTVWLTVSSMTNGGAYSLVMPANIVQAVATGLGNLAATVAFTGVATAPSVAGAEVLNSTQVRLTFSVPVNSAEATNTANYSVDNNLAIQSIRQETPTRYVLTVTPMHPTTIYTVTVSNIHDLYGNLVV